MPDDDQTALFDDLPVPADALPDGLVLAERFLSPDEETALVDLVRTLPLQAATYKGYTARRRVVSYGGTFDFDTMRLDAAEPLVAALHPLRDRVAGWAGVATAHLVHTLVAEYAPGTPLGWHRDVPDFEDVFGVSLGGSAVMRLCPYPPMTRPRADVRRVVLAPRSVYALRGAARWAWQHSVAPVDGWRWSVTFRTARLPVGAGAGSAGADPAG